MNDNFNHNDSDDVERNEIDREENLLESERGFIEESPKGEEPLNSYPVFVEDRTEKRKGKGFIKYVAVALISSLVTSGVVGGGLYYKFSSDLNSIKGDKASKTESVIDYSKQQVSLPKGSAVEEVVKKVAPSVVGIRVTDTSPKYDLFGQQVGGQGDEGSGVIISKDGYIMTNYHVVANADPKAGKQQSPIIEVFLPDKRQAKAKFIGGDSKNDLAVIKIEMDNLPVAELADSSKIQAGETAVAIGNPLGMDFAGSVTVGVISAVERTMEVEGKTLKLIQTDAAINPGNSGGALVNSQGQVIGINTVKISVTGVEGLGFAIPTNEAKPIVDQIVAYGYVKGRPSVGISGRDITEAISKAYDLPMGVYIEGLLQNGAAEKAGIQRKDIITAVDGKEIKSIKDLEAIKKNHKAGDKVKLDISRSGKKITLDLVFDEEK